MEDIIANKAGTPDYNNIGQPSGGTNSVNQNKSQRPAFKDSRRIFELTEAQERARCKPHSETADVFSGEKVKDGVLQSKVALFPEADAVHQSNLDVLNGLKLKIRRLDAES